MQEVSGVFQPGIFLVKESKKRRRKQPGKLMAQSALNEPPAKGLIMDRNAHNIVKWQQVPTKWKIHECFRNNYSTMTLATICVQMWSVNVFFSTWLLFKCLWFCQVTCCLQRKCLWPGCKMDNVFIAIWPCFQKRVYKCLGFLYLNLHL